MNLPSNPPARGAVTDRAPLRTMREKDAPRVGLSGAGAAAAHEATDLAAPVRVIVADDHPLVLYALESLLANYPNLQLVARAQSVPELFEVAAQHSFDLVLMDLYMALPGEMDGPEAIRAFRVQFPQKAVVVLTMENDASVLRKTIDLEVSAVLSKRDRLDLIPVAIVSAMAREHYVGPVVRDLLAEAARTERREEVHRILTRREFEVLTHYARGLGVTEIAGLLGRSVKTISAQKCAAMKKLALGNDIELYRFAVECGVTQVEPA
ncbi:DNA-binding response regulator, NarL/FixJ family, contains REC and HTH domains [Paraburkholderia unamae]|uniref:response regulator transcription factor n=1 Tax=Paraburkholderia unamae TaxID=219649 RepID=UPI001CB630BA|nr:response regulator transcription factor [Paraburkholderia unamae]CAG9270155.1 DNA-binding response regulator, NarL/FixJ family, contains REC and HTH domains [Paraburkholderia unamae]